MGINGLSLNSVFPAQKDLSLKSQWSHNPEASYPHHCTQEEGPEGHMQILFEHGTQISRLLLSNLGIKNA